MPSARGVLVLAHRHQLRAEARVLDPPSERGRDRGQGEDHDVKASLLVELEIRRGLAQWNLQADARAGEGHGVRHDPEHLREGEGHQCEIGAAQPVAEAQRAHEGAGGGAEDPGEDEADPGVDAEIDLKDRGGVSARAEERGVAEAALAAVAPEQIPGLAQQPEIECHDREVQPEIRVHHQRQRR